MSRSQTHDIPSGLVEPLGAQVTITETKPPEGYDFMSPNPRVVTLPSAPTKNGKPVEIEIENFKERTDVPFRVRKLDQDDRGKVLQGAKLKAVYWDGDGEYSLGEKITDKNGIAYFGDFPLNAHVIVTEVEVPEGYGILVSTQEIAGTLGDEPTDNGVYTMNFLNKKENTTDLVLIKKDKNNTTKTLAGAIFQIEWTENGETKTLTSEASAADGKVRFTGLPLSATVKVT